MFSQDQNGPDQYTVRQISNLVKHHYNTWSTISGYFLVLPLCLNLIKSKTFEEGLENIVSYPISIASYGIIGSMFGFGLGMTKYSDKVGINAPSYTAAVSETLINDLHSYVQNKLQK